MIGRESITAQQVKETIFLHSSSGCCFIEDVSNEQSGCSEIMLHVSKLGLFGFILMHVALRERVLCSMSSSVFVLGCSHCLPCHLPSCLC